MVVSTFKLSDQTRCITLWPPGITRITKANIIIDSRIMLQFKTYKYRQENKTLKRAVKQIMQLQSITHNTKENDTKHVTSKC